MLNFDNLFELQIMMLILLLLGYILRKKELLTTKGRKEITDLVINIVLPCSIINSFLIEMNKDILLSTLSIFIVSIVIQFICLFASNFLYRKFNNEQQKVLKYATICSNAGFMGSPLVEGIYGTTGLLYASIYLIPLRISMWSAGLSCFTNAKGKEVLKRVMTHPCIIAVYIGLFFMITQIQLPSVGVRTLTTIGGCTTALSMTVIGAILAEVRLNTIISKGTLYYSSIRLIIIPAVVLCLCYFAHVKPLVTAVSVVLSGMPAGTTTAILASKFNGDEQFAVKCVFLSTVLSMITIPILCIIIEYLI